MNEKNFVIVCLNFFITQKIFLFFMEILNIHELIKKNILLHKRNLLQYLYNFVFYLYFIILSFM